MALDLKITGGTIIDGTGAERRTGDVGIKDGRVVSLDTSTDAAAQTIEATGRVVCPGFVDIHTHYDAQIVWDPMLSISPWHGVTTVVIGNCGFGVAPTRAAQRELIVRTLEKVEGMSADALFEGLGHAWPFETFPEYLDAVESGGHAINVAAMVGHTPLRLYTMGADAMEREATQDEVAEMKQLVAEALDAGALGFASSKSTTHVGFEGRPVPSRLASTEEIIEIASALADSQHGMMQATIGPGLMFDEFRPLTERTGRTLSWTALLTGMADDWLLEESHKLADEGFPVRPQMSVRPLNFEFDLDAPFIFEGSRLFADISATDHAGKVAIYADEEWQGHFRERMLGKGAGTFRATWDRAVVSWYPPDPSLEERNVAELAEEQGIDPSDLVVQLSLDTDLEARFRMAVMNFDEDRVADLLRDPITHIGLSDAGAHASQLCDACFSTHTLSHWVRDKGVLTLEEAVRRLTSEPAEVFGIVDRGLLAEGRPADVVVFDPDTVGASQLRRVNDLPAGADRLVSDAVGIDAVVVNGTVIRQHGTDVVAPGGPLPGTLLRRGRG